MEQTKSLSPKNKAELKKLLEKPRIENNQDYKQKHEAIEIPKENLKVTFNEIMRYLSERIDNEIRLQILGKTLTPHGEKKQKHEKIERMAWKLFEKYLTSDVKLIVNKKQLVNSKDMIRFCWGRAEEFYHYAKEKQEEDA